jgi:hypothetical protein
MCSTPRRFRIGLVVHDVGIDERLEVDDTARPALIERGDHLLGISVRHTEPSLACRPPARPSPRLRLIIAHA